MKIVFEATLYNAKNLLDAAQIWLLLTVLSCCGLWKISRPFKFYSTVSFPLEEHA
jgi:hypothetical protein